jgi:hypothetical protein
LIIPAIIYMDAIATIVGAAGPLNISFRFGLSAGTGVATGLTASRSQVLAFQHRPYLSTSALTGNTEAYDSGLIDLGNGSLAAGLVNVIAMGTEE